MFIYLYILKQVSCFVLPCIVSSLVKFVVLKCIINNIELNWKLKSENHFFVRLWAHTLNRVVSVWVLHCSWMYFSLLNIYDLGSGRPWLESSKIIVMTPCNWLGRLQRGAHNSHWQWASFANMAVTKVEYWQRSTCWWCWSSSIFVFLLQSSFCGISCLWNHLACAFRGL